VLDDPNRRFNMIKSALRKCHNKGLSFQPDHTIVFGDTPRDYLATTFFPGDARPYAVLVATGDYKTEDLCKVVDANNRQAHLILQTISKLRQEVFFKSLCVLHK